MISKLRGIVDTLLEDSIIVDVNGVGYLVYISSKFKDSIKVGDNIDVRIHHIFKQEQQYLCGFRDSEEMNIFKALLDVPGIGVKSAMSVLSTLSTQEFAMAVANQDPTTLCRAGGVGKKTAERILLELKDKTLTKIKDVCSGGQNNVNDAILGLISLGYQKNNISKVISEVSAKIGPDATANELIIQCLKEIK